jgi:glycosyltransferase involved in cell wall biosynthesis
MSMRGLGGSVFVACDDALRRLVAAAARVPVIGGAITAGKRAAQPLRRALVGPRLDAALRRRVERLSSRLALPPDAGRPLHVGLLCVFGDAPVGGISVWSRMLAVALVTRGHRVSLFHLARTRDDAHVEMGVRFVPVPASPIRRWPPLPPITPWLQDYLRGATEAVLAEHEADAFDVVSGPIYLIEALPLLRAGVLPVAVSLHTNESVNAAQGLPSPSGDAPAHEKQAILDAERELLEGAPIVIGNSVASTVEIMGASGLAVDPSRVHVVAHGMPDLAGTVAVPPRPAPEGVRLVFVGRLGARKGIDTLLDALPSVVEAGAFSVDIAGAPDGHDPEPAFRARHAGQPWLDRVRFHGGVDDATKWRLIAAADIAVIPSRYESFGLVAVEAMMFGKPVISTTAGGIPEVVEHGVTGLLVPPGDAQALADAMRGLIDDADLRARMGEAGRALYLAKFTDTAMADAWVAAIREGLARVAARRQ